MMSSLGCGQIIFAIFDTSVTLAINAVMVLSGEMGLAQELMLLSGGIHY